MYKLGLAMMLGVGFIIGISTMAFYREGTKIVWSHERPLAGRCAAMDGVVVQTKDGIWVCVEAKREIDRSTK